MRVSLRLIALVAAVAVGYVAADRLIPAQAQSRSTASYAATPNTVGSLEATGPYDVVPNWPKDLSTTPGNEKWTFGAGQGVFAESPNRVYYIQRGSLPVIPPQGRGGKPIMAPQVAPNLSFPVAGLWRNATQASPPGALFKPGTQEPGDDSDRGQNGVDFLWANCILVINRNGDIIENWTQ